MRRGAFREDLYYRLSVFEIALPPLRDRLDDILELADAFLAEIGGAVGKPPAGIAREAKDQLLAYPWPGNVRELRNAIERAVIWRTVDTSRPNICRSPCRASRPSRQRKTPAMLRSPGEVNLEDLERSLVTKALLQARYNKTRAAKLLGLTRAQLMLAHRKCGLAETTNGPGLISRKS